MLLHIIQNQNSLMKDGCVIPFEIPNGLHPDNTVFAAIIRCQVKIGQAHLTGRGVTRSGSIASMPIFCLPGEQPWLRKPRGKANDQASQVDKDHMVAAILRRAAGIHLSDLETWGSKDIRKLWPAPSTPDIDEAALTQSARAAQCNKAAPRYVVQRADECRKATIQEMTLQSALEFAKAKADEGKAAFDWLHNHVEHLMSTCRRMESACSTYKAEIQALRRQLGERDDAVEFCNSRPEDFRMFVAGIAAERARAERHRAKAA